VSGLTNLARNIGGSVGTAFLVTVLARRAQYHQHRLGDHLSPSSMAMQNEASTMAHYLHDKAGMAYSLMQGRGMAQGTVMRQLIMHSTMLAYLDVINGAACLLDDQGQRRSRRRRPLSHPT
jgi:DHA2 family multidrug resistance protein